jgi:plastocyanin
MRLRRILLATLLPATLVGPALVLAAPAGAGGGGGTCHFTSVTTGKGQAVEMRNNCFSPTVLHAPIGEAVTFVNRDAAPHTVTGAGEWGTGHKVVFRGQSFHLRFQEPGLYLYACVIHPGMIGAVYVGAGPGIDVANSDSVTSPDDDLTTEQSSSEEASADDLQVETASAAGESSGASPSLMGLLGVGALMVGYGLGRVRRRRSSGGAG